MDKFAPPNLPGRPSLRLPLALAALFIAVVTAAVIAYDVSSIEDKKTSLLQTIADLKTQQLGDWLKERQSDADYLQGSQSLAEQYRSWRADGDTASREKMIARLEQFRTAKAYQNMLLLNAQGETVWDAATGTMPA